MMVQRTRAAQAERVWSEFVRRWPTAAAGAAATPAELREVLAPLGLAWRSENIIRIVGQLVRCPTDTSTLPGVGHYAAAVIATVCQGRRCPVVDANVVRIYARFFGLTVNDSTRRARSFHNLADALLPSTRERRRLYFWALMDFGALVCTPSNPRCPGCPLSGRCQSFRQDLKRSNSEGSKSTNSSPVIP